MREFEFKYLLDKLVFADAEKKIKQYYPDVIGKEVFQINFYYDNYDFELNKKGITVRIRQKGDTLQLQVKTHLKSANGYVCSNEEVKSIDKLYGSVSIDGKEYNLQGSLNTKRISYIVEEGIKVEFDTNTYLGFEDYEIEIEFLDEKQQEALKIIELLGLQLTPKVKGKATRFFNAKKHIVECNYIIK